MAHTPGPWKVQPGSGDSEYAFNVVAGEPGSVVLVANVAAEDHATRRANARLVASAPDLLAALRELVAAPNKKRPEHVWAEARAAIERAS